MTARRDAYWDELGVAWSAVDPDTAVIAARLKQRLRRQTQLIAAGIVVGALTSFAGLVLGAFTIWLGASGGIWNFVTRGVALVVVSALVGLAVTMLLPVRATDSAQSLLAMLALAIRRAEQTRAAIRLGLYASLVAAVLGLLGAVIRTRLATAPHVSPFIDLSILAVLSIWLFSYSRRLKASAEQLRALRSVLAGNGTEQ